MEKQTRERALLEELFSDHFKLADRFDEAAGNVEKIANVVTGTPDSPGLLADLEEVSDSIREASKALEPIIGSALPAKIESLKRQFDEVPNHILKAASSVEFQVTLGAVMVEAAKPAIEQAQQAASYSVSVHVHGEVGKAVSAAVNEHLVEPMMVKGYIGKLEGEVDGLKQRIAAHEATIDSQKDAIRELSSGKVNRWLLWFTFVMGWACAVFAADVWSVITHWIVQQPIPAWFLPRI
ncbi:TPA: hypothetical protein L5C15_005773 [Pseudomonas aeruginosa]|nr:hypothetical protein [Pseudomonas aeruginosa]HBO8188578.1 hypothetical protein [Pseudomonas aeruginosa]HBO8713827.1 hypothetical protein [Pseudomonas aeruginosa]